MLRSFVAILLITGFLLQSASKLLIIADYQMNKESITKLFCENKDKPVLKCNGKCHLKKQLAKEEKKENAPSNNLKTKIEIQFVSENQTYAFINRTDLKVRNHFLYLFPESDSHPGSVFHPPAA